MCSHSTRWEKGISQQTFQPQHYYIYKSARSKPQISSATNERESAGFHPNQTLQQAISLIHCKFHQKGRDCAPVEVFTFKENLYTLSPQWHDCTLVTQVTAAGCSLFRSNWINKNIKCANSLIKFSLCCISPRGTCHSDHEKCMEVLGNLPLRAHNMPLKLKMRGKNAPSNQGCPSLNVTLYFFPPVGCN